MDKDQEQAMDTTTDESIDQAIATLERALSERGHIIRTPYGEMLRIRSEDGIVRVEAKLDPRAEWRPVSEVPGFKAEMAR